MISLPQLFQDRGFNPILVNGDRDDTVQPQSAAFSGSHRRPIHRRHHHKRLNPLSPAKRSESFAGRGSDRGHRSSTQCLRSRTCLAGVARNMFESHDQLEGLVD